MIPEERQTLDEAIKEALKNRPPWHRVIMGNNGKVYPVRHVIRCSPKTDLESLGTGSCLIYKRRSARCSRDETKRLQKRIYM
jgi:hypothetical protein